MMIQAEKNRLVETDITVNNRPARIIGRLSEFPIVYVIGHSELDQEYCWETVRHIVDEHNGQFKWAWAV